MMKIYDKGGTQLVNSEVLSNLPVTSECEHVEELMHDDYVSLSWRDTERYILPVGSYIIPYPEEGNPTGVTDSRYPLKYRLFEEYDPDGRNEREFEYEPKFQHPIMWLTRIPFVLITGEVSSWADALKKTSWGYTGSVGHIAQFVVDSINWLSAHYPLFGDVFGTGWTAVIDSDLAPSATVNFDGVDIFSGAGLIADAFDCEFHFDFARRQYRLGTIKYDTNLVLKSGDNVGVANISRSKQDFYNAFLIKGSTRNLSQPTDTGENVQLRERLTLDAEDYPDSMMYTDNNGNIITREQFLANGYPLLMKELIFDNIYPKLELYLYNIRERKCWLLDEEGHKVEDSHGEMDTDGKRYKSYSKWYIRLAYPLYNSEKEIVGWQDYTIGEHSIIEGQTLQLSFLANTEPNAYNSLLIGQGDFDMVYFDQQTTEKEDDDINPSGFTAQAGDYRIVFKDSDGFIIPTSIKGGMYPLPVGVTTPSILNNKATLLNIVVDDNYKKIAQQELETAARRKVLLDRANLNNYTVPSNPVYFEQNDVKMHVGQSVTYNDGQDLAGGTSLTLDAHIIKIVSKLDYPFQKEITVGNAKVKTNINMLRDDVDTLAATLGGLGLMNDIELEQLISQVGSRYFLSKLNDDTARGFIRMIKGLQVGERFVTGLLGEGGVFRREADGTSYIEADKLYIRVKAYFDNVEIRDYKHSSGNRIASSAGARCCRVEYIGEDGEIVNDPDDAVLFRCYFRGSDGEDEVRNNFIVGDLAYCHVTSVETAADTPDAKGLNMKHYWRLVVGRNPVGVLTDDGEHWIDLSNSASETITVSGHSYTHAGYQSGSDTPSSQDDIIQLGNIYDTTRQGAIIEFVSGADAPSYQIYQGINTYSLNGKNYIGLGYSSQNARAYLNVYGDAYIGDPNESSYIRYNAGTRNLEIKAKISAQSTIDGETLAQFIAENTWTEEQIDALITAETDPLSDAIEEIRRQVDGNIATWFYDGEPTLQNLPASEWTTDDDKNEHLGDLYYDNLTGYGYRFKYDELNHQWLWGRITDVDVVKALADAAKAQDTADHKRRVFVVQPTPPYDAGDLWVNATYPSGNTETNEAQSKYYNDVLRCKTSKSSGTTFAIADWSLASKYTDDQALEDFKANQYVTALTNGTISTDITNAQNAANTAQGTANSASTAAASAQAAAQAAEAHAATLDYVKTALKQDTVIEGGLVLSTLIALRDGSNHIWSGISGTYQTAETGTGYKGHGIAAWYGGAMVDKEVTTTATDYAKSLFRFDGSGYVASGNLSWDKNGNVTIQGYSINATTLQVGGVGVLTTTAAANTYLSKTDAASTYLTKTDASNTYVSIAFFERLFKAYNGSTVVHPNSTSTIDNIKAMFGFWTEQYISALGKGSSGSSGIDMATVWTALGNATTEQINATHLSNALSAYNKTSNFKTINGNSIVGTGNLEISGGDISNCVTLNTAQTISGLKTMTNGLVVSGRTYGGGDDEGIVVQKATNGYAGITLGEPGGIHTTLYLNSGNKATWVYLSSEGGTKYAIEHPNKNGIIALTSDIPTKVSQLTNDSGFVTSSVVDGYATKIWVGDNYLGIHDTADSAIKLVTARRIWGQMFDGTSYISGTIYLNENVPHYFRDPESTSWRSGLYYGSAGNEAMCFVARGANTKFLFVNNSDIADWDRTTHQSVLPLLSVGVNVGVGVLSPTYKLQVDGTFYASGNSSVGGTLGVSGAATLSSTLSVSGLLTASGGINIPSGKTLTIGDAVLSWDSTNQGIKITKGLYSQTFISALGQGSSGSSGVDMTTVWTALGNATTEQINATHLSNALSSYNPTSNFKTVNGNSIIGTGNLEISGGDISNCVTLNTAQTISGLKTMTNGLIVSGRAYGGYDDEGIVIGLATNNLAALTLGVYNGEHSSLYYNGTQKTSYWVLSDGNNTYRILHPKKSGTIALTSDIPTNISQLTNDSGYITSSGTSAYAGSLNYKPRVTTSEELDAAHWANQLNAYTFYGFNTSILNNNGIIIDGGWEITTYGFQILIDEDPTYIMGLRQKGRSGWSDWKRIPMGDGTGASGTWGISISGNAATATTATSASSATKATQDGDGNTISSTYLKLSGGTVTGKVVFKGVVDGHNYSVAGSNAAAFIFDKPSSNRTGIGAHATNDLIWFGACDLHGNWVDSYKQIWNFNGTLKQDGNAVIDAGNISLQTVATATNCVLKAGDTMTGALNMTHNKVQMNFRLAHNSYNSKMEYMSTGNEAMVWANQNSVTSFIFKCGLDLTDTSDWTGITPSMQIKNQSVYINSLIPSFTSPSYNLYVNGTFCTSGNSTIGGTLGVTGATTIVGSLKAQEVEIIGYNEINSNYGGGLHLQWSSSKNVTLCYGGGSVGIGRSDASYKLHVEGVIYSSTGVYSAGYVTALSDIRHKDVVSYDTGLSVSDVANAPMIRFLWKDKRQDGLQVGSIAQYWQRVLPEAVIEGKNGELTMGYGVIALLSSIATARKVEDLERRVVNLEKENKKLKEQLNAA